MGRKTYWVKQSRQLNWPWVSMRRARESAWPQREQCMASLRKRIGGKEEISPCPRKEQKQFLMGGKPFTGLNVLLQPGTLGIKSRGI